MTYDVEAALRAALNGQPLPKSRNATIRKNFAPPSFFRHQITVRYSVQESWGGPRFVVSFTEDSIIHEQVKQNAIAEMNRLGYTNIFFLDLTST